MPDPCKLKDSTCFVGMPIELRLKIRVHTGSDGHERRAEAGLNEPGSQLCPDLFYVEPVIIQIT